MSKRVDAVVEIDGLKIANMVDIGDLSFRDGEPGDLPITSLGPVVIEGTFDTDYMRVPEGPRELVLMAGRRFLWWTVAVQRIRQTVRLKAHTIATSPEGVTVSVPMQCEGLPRTIRSPLWERTLYAIAGLWS